MSEIPYYFETPVPKYFRENGWYTNPNTVLFLTWAFSRCSSEKRTIFHDHKEITLEPFEFITGLYKSSAESFLSVEAFRHQLNTTLNAGLLKKTPNSTPHRYTCYVWLTDRFSKSNPTLNPKLTKNLPHTEPQQSYRRKKTRYKTSHPSIPSFEIDRPIRDAGLMTDDFFLPKEKTEVVTGVFLTPEELDACIAIKGDVERVKHAIEFIQSSKKRKHPISDWPNALSRWKIENKAQNMAKDHIKYSEKICEEFAEFENGHGWRCYMYNDRKKDQTGLLFESVSAYQEAFFVALVDGEFQKKCDDFIRKKNMRKNTI
jgi:hypothetical protein